MSLFNKGNALMLAFIAFFTLTGCTTPAENESATADGNVTTEEVIDQPAFVDGETVTIRSEVVQKVDESSFTLRDSRSGEAGVLVVNVSGKPFVLPEDEDLAVQVTGEVDAFTLVELQQEYNLELEPELYTEYETKPAILAESLALAPDPGQVTESPERFYGLAIAIEGEVEKALDANTITLDEEQLFGASDLLVMNVPPQPSTDLEGERVTVTGTLRPFVLAEFERDYELTWDLEIQEEIEAEYTDKPVFIAEAIYPTAQ